MENNNTIALLTKELPTIEAIIKLNASPGANVAAIALQELDFLSMHMIAKPFIAQCIPETVVQAVKYSLKNNLSLDPNAGLVYLMPTSVNIGGVYKQALDIKPTADGKLSIAYQCGTILDNERPVITKNETGMVIGVSVKILLPSVPLPRWEKIEMDYSDFERLRKFSHIKNARNWTEKSGKPKPDMAALNYANPLYTSFHGGIDPEFARSKVVSIALKKRGTNLAAKLSERITTTSVNKEVSDEKIEQQNVEYAEIIESATSINTSVAIPSVEDL